MVSINILHASDLHISVHRQLRSPIDRLHDLENPWDISFDGLVEKALILPSFAEAWWKKMAASSYDPEALQALAEFIYKHARSKLDEAGLEIVDEGEDTLDAVVLTGDLATTGSYDDIKQASRFLWGTPGSKCAYKSEEKNYRGATLAAVKVPILCLPGNHDRFIAIHGLHGISPVVLKPGSQEFDKQLIDYRKSCVQELLLCKPISKTTTLRTVILAVDFTLENIDDCEGYYGWLAQGRAYSDRRKALVHRTDQLNAAKGENEVLCVIWAMHFPPDFPRYPAHSKLIREEAVIQKANRTNVQAILAGHTHEQLTYQNPGMNFWVFCCGTTTQYEPLAITQSDGNRGNFFQIITVTADDQGQINITGKDYKYGDSGTGSRPRDLNWREFP